jgi:hypothetical protein
MEWLSQVTRVTVSVVVSKAAQFLWQLEMLVVSIVMVELYFWVKSHPCSACRWYTLSIDGSTSTVSTSPSTQIAIPRCKILLQYMYIKHLVCHLHHIRVRVRCLVLVLRDMSTKKSNHYCWLCQSSWIKKCLMKNDVGRCVDVLLTLLCDVSISGKKYLLCHIPQ